MNFTEFVKKYCSPGTTEFEHKMYYQFYMLGKNDGVLSILHGGDEE